MKAWAPTPSPAKKQFVPAPCPLVKKITLAPNAATNYNSDSGSEDMFKLAMVFKLNACNTSCDDHDKDPGYWRHDMQRGHY